MAALKRRTIDTIGVITFAALCIGAALAIALMGVVRDLRHGSLPVPPPPPLSSKGMLLKGAEDCDGPAGAAPNPGYFDYELGGGGWGDGEKQVYTRNPENVRLSGTGNLIIQAQRSGNSFTSARVVTRGHLSFEDGLVEARIKLPEGFGLRSAFWMLGAKLNQVGYPARIDIIDLVDDGGTFRNAIHGPRESDATEWKLSKDGDPKTNLAEDFHVYQVYREPGLIKIGIDGMVVAEYTRSSKAAGTRWDLDDPMFLLFNMQLAAPRPAWLAPRHHFRQPCWLTGSVIGSE
jgi:hypothetical protein